VPWGVDPICPGPLRIARYTKPFALTVGQVAYKRKAARNWRTSLSGLEIWYKTHEGFGEAMTPLAEWDSFYVIVGSAAGALIGLQFVVMTLIAERPPLRAAAEAGAAFATPTIVHFSAALFLAAVLRAPWQAVTAVAALWGFLGFSGTAYAIVVARRMRTQTAYQPQLEDWLFHALLPLIAYASLPISAFAAASHPREVLFGVGGAVLLLLFLGIHNAWDAVAYLVHGTSTKD